MLWGKICVDLKVSQDDCKAVMHVPETVICVVVLAGKCANRLLAPSGAPEVFKQMKVCFSANVFLCKVF